MCNYKTEILSDSYVLENYKCNRAIYKNNYCIFHYGLKDNNSNEINEDEVKQKESDFNYALQVYLNDKKLKEYDFIGWVFPEISFKNFTINNQNKLEFNLPVKFIKTIFAYEVYFDLACFLKKVNFYYAKFESLAAFGGTKFLEDVFFEKAKFLKSAWFENVHFKADVGFDKAHFLVNVCFENVKIECVASFEEAKFDGIANFFNTKFGLEAYFTKAQFESEVDFTRAQFEDDVDFENVTFNEKADFKNAKFKNKTKFKEAKFEGEANFEKAIFKNIAFFPDVNFAKEAYFNNSFFTKGGYFKNSIFAKEVHFDKTIFLNKFVLDNVYCKENIIIANCFIQSVNIEIFKSDSFFIISNSCIENIVIQNSIFQKINFNNVLSNSINDDLKKIFKKNEIEIKNESTENIEWNFSGQDLSNFSFIECDFSVANFLSANIQKTHIDNCIFPTDKVGRKKLFYHNTNEDEIKLQFTYQRFKRQFTENHYYQLAQDFHFQEMELRKKLSKNVFEKIVLKIYFFLSRYGTNYLRPFIYLLIWVFIYPIILLYKTWEINLFCNTWDFDLYGQTFSALFKLLAPFKLIHGNDDDFLNIYNIYINTGFGIFLVVFFYIIVTILITMFLQALSRNFKR